MDERRCSSAIVSCQGRKKGKRRMAGAEMEMGGGCVDWERHIGRSRKVGAQVRYRTVPCNSRLETKNYLTSLRSARSAAHHSCITDHRPQATLVLCTWTWPGCFLVGRLSWAGVDEGEKKKVTLEGTSQGTCGKRHQACTQSRHSKF